MTGFNSFTSEAHLKELSEKDLSEELVPHGNVFQCMGRKFDNSTK